MRKPDSNIAATMSFRPERMSRFGQIISVTYVLWALVYLVWRAGTLNPDAPIFSALIYGAEIFGFATTLLHLFMVWDLSVRIAPTPEAGLSVDIFVPTYNESTEIVRRTLIAAKNVDYPHAVWLLDDGNRAAMAELARELDVRYLARTDNTHAKAGNLNNALRHSTAEFIAIFDADHAPKRTFLDATLGFFVDARVAFVQTPQDFFNLDSFQHRHNEVSGSLWTEQSLFFRIIQRGKDRWGAAFFCGSCAVVRRSALEKIGGFATQSVTEDLETSVALHHAGYRSVYVPDALAFGLAPSTASAYLVQRVRWGQGAMQVIRKEWFFLRGRLTLPQRVNYMASALTYFDGWAKSIFYVAPAWVLISGNTPLLAPMGIFLGIFVPYLLMNFLVFEEAGRGYGRSMFIEQYNMARFAAFVWATFGLIPRRLKFKVTSKENVSAVAAEARAMSPQIAIGALNLLAILVGVALWLLLDRELPLSGLIANVIWALVNTALAAFVVVFTVRRSRFGRKTYRFPVPLPASTRFDGVQHLMTVDDISLMGCRMYGRFPTSLQLGDTVTGTLFPPGISIPFKATVARLVPHTDGNLQYFKSIGLTFQWQGATQQDRLGLFLYGSDLQWKFHDWKERIDTPLEVGRRMLSGKAGRHRAESAHWSAAIVGETPSSYGLVRSQDSANCLLVGSHASIVFGETLSVRQFTRSGIHLLALRDIKEVAQLSTPAGVLYLYEGVAISRRVLSGSDHAAGVSSWPAQDLITQS